MRYDLTPLNELVARLRKEGEEDAQRWAENARRQKLEQIQEAETNRQAVALLDAAEIPLSIVSNLRCVINLGFFGLNKAGRRDLANAVRKIRDVLGRMEVADKDVLNAKEKTIRITLKPVDYPTVKVRYEQKLPKGGKCKIVRSRSSYASLMCEV